MAANTTHDQLSGDDFRDLEVLELIILCGRDMGDTQLWAEFLRRFEPRIKLSIVRAIRHFANGSGLRAEYGALSGACEANDLFQITFLRLLNRDCAFLKQFRGVSEEELLAYLAILAQSVVRDSLRRERALKRPKEHRSCVPDELDFLRAKSSNGVREKEPAAERHVLAEEVRQICLRSIKNMAGSSHVRDREIFELHFSDGLSAKQIAQTKTIGLSTTTVKNIVNRLKSRVHSIAAGKGVKP